MRTLKKILAIVYVLAAVFLLGTMVLSLVGPAQERLAELVSLSPFRVALFVCAGIVAIQLLYVLGLVLFDKPEPASIHPGANPNIEVTLSAIQAVARASAVDTDVMVESVTARASRRTPSVAYVQIDAIALTEQGLEGLAHRMQQRVEGACERMLGCPGVAVHVRFLPSKSVTVTKEVSDD